MLSEISPESQGDSRDGQMLEVEKPFTKDPGEVRARAGCSAVLPVPGMDPITVIWS